MPKPQPHTEETLRKLALTLLRRLAKMNPASTSGYEAALAALGAYRT